MARSVKAFERLGLDGCLVIARQIRDEVDAFKPNLPLITSHAQPRHARAALGAELSDAIGLKVDPEKDKAAFTLTTALGMNLQAHLEGIGKVAEKAAKEFQIETALDKMARRVGERGTGGSALPRDRHARPQGRATRCRRCSTSTRR